MATGGLYGNSGTGALVAQPGAETPGLYGKSPNGSVVAQPGSESAGLYGNGTTFGGSYFEWFIFKEASSQPATPTGGSWSFVTNTGTPPTGWTLQPPVAPTNQVWVSIALVNSRSTDPLVWSTPGLFGVVPQFTFPTPVTGAPGTNAAVVNSGTATNPILTFTIPRGATGATGATGPTGPTGSAATIAVGTTTTGAPGTSASVANSGSSSAAVFDFTIPRGDVGAGVASGGTTNQVLAKNSNTNYDTKWITPTAGTVTGVTGTSPVVSSGGATPDISLAASYGDTQNPYASKTANYVLAAPNGSSGVPSFRAIVVNDIPTLNQNTTGTASNVTGVVAVANGGTGVTVSSGANSVVLRDANQNITANAFDNAYTNVAASGTQITLTTGSPRRYTITGSGGQVIKLPDATTLVSGAIFEFDNNQSSGAITVNNNSNTLIVSVPSGGIVRVNLLSNASAAGSWDRHDFTPSNVSWSTNTLDYAGSITSATWNGVAVAVNRGGTGASTASGARTNLGLGTIATQDANNVAITGGSITGITDLAVADGGTGASTLTGYVKGSGTTPLTASATIPSSDITGLGTIASQDANNVAITGGAINGTTVGATTASTGAFTTLSATSLDNTVIGGTTPAAGTFTTLTGNSTSQFGRSSANYLQAVGGATTVAPVLSAQGSDTDIPLVLQPKGTGALQAQATTSSATGGNARGANAVDLQTNRNAGAQVASQPYSVISGGTTNTANGFGSAMVGGTSNTSSNNYSFVGAGALNAASGIQSSVVGGWANTASGYFGFVGNGFTNSTTSNTAVTTQSATMNGTTAVTLAASNANIKVGQYITGTSIAADTYVSAISGTSLTLSKVASGSSTSTLSFFTPHGVVVGGGNNQATGSYSFIGGGGDAGTAANRNVASGDWSVVVGGRVNQATGVASFVGGGGFEGTNLGTNLASGTCSSVMGGFQNTASGVGSAVTGGFQNTANSTQSTCVGGRRATTRSIIGNTVFSASENPIADSNGLSQSALLILATQTTDATATVLRSNTQAASTTNQVILPNNSAYYFKGSVIANVTGAANGAAWAFEGAIMRGANAGSTVLIGTPAINRVASTSGASAWTIALTADTSNGGLAVTVTGAASTTIRWVSSISTTEVTF